MSILDDIIRRVGVYNFDPSDVQLVVAGWDMSDFTTASITPTQRQKTEQGIDVLYHDYVTLPNHYTITISVLASCRDLDMLQQLQADFNTLGGWFQISCVQNGRFIGIFDCYFTGDSSDMIGTEANDKTFEFAGVKLDDDMIGSDMGAFETPVAIMN